jgi:hypothetical protein
MPFQLSKADQLAKTEMLAKARERLILLNAQVATLNNLLNAARASIEKAHFDYGIAVRELEAFAARVAADQEVALLKASAGRRLCNRSQDVLDWIEIYRSFRPRLLHLSLPEPVDELDDDLLSHFEELPDSP